MRPIGEDVLVGILYWESPTLFGHIELFSPIKIKITNTVHLLVAFHNSNFSELDTGCVQEAGKAFISSVYLHGLNHKGVRDPRQTCTNKIHCSQKA